MIFLQYLQETKYFQANTHVDTEYNSRISGSLCISVIRNLSLGTQTPDDGDRDGNIGP
jgi:hypothetical protein